MSATQKKWKGIAVTDGNISISGDLIISVKEARKVLGGEFKSMDDDDVMRIVLSFTKMANNLFDNL